MCHGLISVDCSAQVWIGVDTERGNPCEPCHNCGNAKTKTRFQVTKSLADCATVRASQNLQLVKMYVFKFLDHSAISIISIG